MSADYEFACPHCGERLLVDGSVRETLLVEGCVVCGERVERGAFDRVDG